jgi:hypothetical protein
MLVRLGPDGRCPSGHPRSRIHDTFETRGSSSASSVFFEPDAFSSVTGLGPVPAPAGRGLTPPPQQAPTSQRVTVATPAANAPSGTSVGQQQVRTVRRVAVIVIGIFIAIQMITVCGGLLAALFSGD